ncbi:MAG TPA: ABC transporter permease [Leptolyngbyaceae cyanobacterium M33_DOE_097]|uniref:ABC transporter permease n=1 Tax=Oscillatoriales cyanobacterium SpSt-418 TaxID=2282169 RepID=A0A7C3KFW2_9CYAN|nr:ABC transporter permease [Leptolyngbyaceae cyanobacterium M33_DOE_097]
MALHPIALFSLTCQALKTNLLRSALTTLGMFMGVAAVTSTLHVKSISQAVIAAELAERDGPQVGIGVAWLPRRDRIPFRAEDIEFLRPRLPKLRSIAAVNWAGTASVVYQGQEADPVMLAVSKDFLKNEGYPLAAGRFFTDADYTEFRPVAVIDEFLAKRLFEGKNPLGERIYADGQPFVVVGILPTKKSDEEPRGLIQIPLAIYSAINGDQTIDSIQVAPADIRDLEELGKQARSLLQQVRPDRRLWDFNNSEDILAKQRTLDMAGQALTAVAIISLLIGGVGIANVMIASVTERTPEIGLRRAIGATKRDVMLQFILEAATLSLIGGTGALVSVHGLTLVVAEQFDLPYQFEFDTGAIALGSALFVGIAAGIPPAYRAAQLDPIKALKAE